MASFSPNIGCDYDSRRSGPDRIMRKQGEAGADPAGGSDMLESGETISGRDCRLPNRRRTGDVSNAFAVDTQRRGAIAGVRTT